MKINFFNNTISELNQQIQTAALLGDKDTESILQDIKETFVKELKEMANGSKFLVSFVDQESNVEMIKDEGFSIKELEGIAFIQPLDALAPEHVEELAIAIEETKEFVKDKEIIIVPYDIKIMTATLMTKLDSNMDDNN